MQLSLKNNPNLTGILQWTAIAALSLAFIASLFPVPPGVEFTRGYFELGLDRIVFLLLFFTALFHLKGLPGKWLAFMFALALFCIPLLYKWQTADFFSTLGGLLPLRDANSYYQEAQNLIHGFPLVGAATFRPIYTSFLATVMKTAGGNLQAALIVLVAVNALSAFFAAREVQRAVKSSLAAALFLILCYIFYRRFAGTLLTENLGFCLGNLALVLLLRGAAEKKLNLILYGIFLLTTGLNARAGAYFILPVLALWAGVTFRGAMGFWRPLLLGVLVVVIGMAANSALVKFVSASPSVAFSNYSYTLYGIAAGNKGWEQAGIDHPDAGANEVYSLAFRMIRENPAQFAQGVAGAYADYFIASKGAFSFLLMKHDRNDAANIVLWILSLAGLGAAVVDRRRMEFSISIAFFIGIILSVGLVPPVDSTQMRAYAATIPMSGYIVAAGMALPGRFMSKGTNQLPAENEAGISIPVGLSALILASSLILPVLFKLSGHPPAIDAAVSCNPGRDKLGFVIAGGSSITLSAEKGFAYVPDIDMFRFFGKIVHPEQQLTQEEKDMLMAMEPGTTITLVRSVLTGTDAPPPGIGSFLITQGVPQPGVYTWCVDEPQFSVYYSAPAGEYEIEPSSSLSNSIQSPIRIARQAGMWLVFVFILAAWFDLSKFPARKIPLAALNAALIAAGLLLVLHMTGIAPLVWERRTLETDKMQHREGFMYAYNTGDDRISDTNYRDYPTFLYEDGILLYQPHESQSVIASLGRGSYILKGKFLYFSSTDNSDPETNSREYTLETPARVRFRYQSIVFGAALIGLVLHFFYFIPSLRRDSP